MPDETTPPVQPPKPEPAPAAPVVAAKTSGLAKAGVVLAVAVAGIAAFLLIDRFVFHRDPLPAPKAVVRGTFWPAPQSGGLARATGGGPTPIGMFRLDASGSTSIMPFRWKSAGPKVGLRVYTPMGSPLLGTIAEADVYEPGHYSFHGTAIGHTAGQIDADVDTATFTVEGPDPTPVPPSPPVPPPGPTPPPPPPPTPVPPAPIAGDGLRVLFVYESADLSKYPKDQLNVFYDQSFRDYLSTACAKVNGVPEYRVWDKDTDLANESKSWQDAMKRPHPELPWMVVSNGKTGYEGKVPADVAEARSLVQKYEVKP